MALTSIQAALAQYNAACPWHLSQANATLALAAIQYLLANRAQKLEDRGSTINFESLIVEKKAIEQFLGATAPRSFGRSRRVRACFGSTPGIE